MEWVSTEKPGLMQRRLGKALFEYCGFAVAGPEAIQIDNQILLQAMPLFERFVIRGKMGWPYAPSSLRLTSGQVQDISTDVIEWAQEMGIIAEARQNGKFTSCRLMENWQDWVLAQVAPRKTSSIDWQLLDQAIQQYGQLGLRTAAHIAFGNSHVLDGVSLPLQYTASVWSQPDIIVTGANVVRAGGKINLKTSDGMFYPERWQRPGLFIWGHDLAEEPTQISIGGLLLLIENPYPYWELLHRWNNQSITFICIHGETLRAGPNQDYSLSAIGPLLQWIYKSTPKLETLIWCDPDPAGLVIAHNAFRLVSELGGTPRFWMMGEDILDRLEALVLAKSKLRPLEDYDHRLLKRTLHPGLASLAREISARGLKGEQEALSITPDTLA